MANSNRGDCFKKIAANVMQVIWLKHVLGAVGLFRMTWAWND
jgi:hypothetical protein